MNESGGRQRPPWWLAVMLVWVMLLMFALLVFAEKLGMMVEEYIKYVTGL